MTPVQLRRLLPEPAVLTPAEALDGIALGDLAPDGRVYVVLNMVATVDARRPWPGAPRR